MKRAASVLLVCVGLTLTACSSTSSSSSSSTSSQMTGGIPAVSGTDVTKAPVVSAGTGTPPTMLMTKDLKVGTGPKATASDTVTVNYVGTNYADGKIFDSSWSRGSAATFPLNQVVPGFSQGIVGMQVGGRRVIVIPPDLGYGSSGTPADASGNQAVAGGETIVFVVDLVAINPAG